MKNPPRQYRARKLLVAVAFSAGAAGCGADRAPVGVGSPPDAKADARAVPQGNPNAPQYIPDARPYPDQGNPNAPWYTPDARPSGAGGQGGPDGNPNPPGYDGPAGDGGVPDALVAIDAGADDGGLHD
jgi:hypothetical protein